MKREEIITSASPLPGGYRQLEYIEGTGTQYIDTGVLNGEFLDFELEFKPTDTQFNYWIFGSRYGSMNDEYGLLWQVNDSQHVGLCLRLTYKGNQYFNSLTTNSFHKVKLDGNDFYIDGVLKNSFQRTAFYNKYSVIINGGNQQNNTIWPGNSSWKSVKLWYDSNLVRDYIPALRISDLKSGLYDLVNNQFYTNAGTGEFLYV